MEYCPNCQKEMCDALPGAIANSGELFWCPECSITVSIEPHYDYHNHRAYINGVNRKVFKRVKSMAETHTIMWNDRTKITQVFALPKPRITPSENDCKHSSILQFPRLLSYSIEDLERLENLALLL